MQRAIRTALLTDIQNLYLYYYIIILNKRTEAETREHTKTDEVSFYAVLGIRIGFNADPYPAFYLNLDPDPAQGCLINADPCGSGSWSDLGAEAFLKGRNLGFFANFCQFSCSLRSKSAFLIRVRIQDSQTHFGSMVRRIRIPTMVSCINFLLLPVRRSVLPDPGEQVQEKSRSTFSIEYREKYSKCYGFKTNP